jgi:hypothetical protein
MSRSIRIFKIILGRVKIRKYYHHQEVIMMGTNKIVPSLQINNIRGNVEDPERTIVPLLLKELPLSWRERQAHAVGALSFNSSQKPLPKWQSATPKGKIQLPDMVAIGMPVRWKQITAL